MVGNIRKIICSIFLVLIVVVSGVNFNQTDGLLTSDENGIVSAIDLPYFSAINKTFKLTQAEINLLDQNSFVVLNRMGTDDILDAYNFYWEEDLPLFITSDSILQIWHLIFDNLLEKAEEMLFYPLLLNLSRECLNILLNEDIDSFKIEQLDVLTYLAVPLLLDNVSTAIPTVIEKSAFTIYNAIMNEVTFPASLSIFSSNQTKRFVDDFSQYKPRGHYTQSEILKTYFRMFKWLSRIPFYFNGYPSQSFLGRTPNQLMNSAITLTWVLTHSEIPINGSTTNGLKIWSLFNDFLNNLVGRTYSISPINLNDIITSEINKNWKYDELSESNIKLIHDKVYNNDSIPFQKDMFVADAYTGQPTVNMKSFVFFGERLTLDTYALDNLVYPHTDKFLPTGLDFAIAMFNSSRAWDLLRPDYDTQIQNVQDSIANWEKNETNTIVMNWIDSLGELTVEIPDTLVNVNESALPSFLTSIPWQDEKLTTVLGSWAQLKHDTILYAKQGYSLWGCSTPDAYVEPYPQFYKKIKNLNNQFASVLGPISDLGIPFNLYTFSRFDSALKMLFDIAEIELQGIPLNETHRQFLKHTYSTRSLGSGMILLEGWLASTISSIKKEFSKPSYYPNTRASLIADIHTDTNSGGVLEVASGQMEHIIAKVPGFNQTILAVGPVFSYYEFITSVNNRLTDEEWRGILQAERSAKNTNVSIPRGFWAQNYMISTSVTTSIIYYDDVAYSAPSWYRDGDSKLFSPYSDIFIPEPITIETSSIDFIDFFENRTESTNPFQTTSIINVNSNDSERDSSTSFQSGTTNINIIEFIILFVPFIMIKSRRKKRND